MDWVFKNQVPGKKNGKGFLHVAIFNDFLKVQNHLKCPKFGKKRRKSLFKPQLLTTFSPWFYVLKNYDSRDITTLLLKHHIIDWWVSRVYSTVGRGTHLYSIFQEH